MTPEIPLGWVRVIQGESQVDDQFWRFPNGGWDDVGAAFAGQPHAFFRLLIRRQESVGHDQHQRCKKYCKPCADLYAQHFASEEDAAAAAYQRLPRFGHIRPVDHPDP